MKAMQARPSPSAILEAMRTLGRACEEDVTSALSELFAHVKKHQTPQGLGRDVHLLELATRSALFCKQIDKSVTVMERAKKATRETHLEMMTIRNGSSVHLHAVTVGPHVGWNAPSETLGSDIIPLLVENIVPKEYDAGGFYMMNLAPTTRRFEHYKAAAVLSQINHHWAAAVKEWHRETSVVWLYGPKDVDVQKILHLSPKITELQIHNAWNEEVEQMQLTITDDSIAALCGSQTLQRLLLRYSTQVTTAALVNLIEACPSLSEIDLASSHLDEDMLLKALPLHPRLTVTVRACDSLFQRSRETATHVQPLDFCSEGHILLQSIHTMQERRDQIRPITCETCLPGGTRIGSNGGNYWECKACVKRIPDPDKSDGWNPLPTFWKHGCWGHAGWE